MQVTSNILQLSGKGVPFSGRNGVLRRAFPMIKVWVVEVMAADMTILNDTELDTLR